MYMAENKNKPTSRLEHHFQPHSSTLRTATNNRLTECKTIYNRHALEKANIHRNQPTCGHKCIIDMQVSASHQKNIETNNRQCISL